jgi:hypothetical protein
MITVPFKKILSLTFEATLGIGFCWFLRFGLTKRPVSIFEASDRNKDASHAPTASKLTLDALHTIWVAVFLARASPNRFLKKQTER